MENYTQTNKENSIFEMNEFLGNQLQFELFKNFVSEALEDKLLEYAQSTNPDEKLTLADFKILYNNVEQLKQTLQMIENEKNAF